jgi:hypothetical protein
MRVLAAATLLAVTATVARPTPAVAQDVGDIAAYAALTFSPTGGLVPLPPPIAGRGTSFLLRYGMLDFGGGGPTLNNFVAGGDFSAGTGRFGLSLGYATCDGCEGNIMAGMDYTASLTQGKAMVAVRPAIGFSKPTEGSGSGLSLAVSFPLGVDLSAGGDGPHLIPYLTPGFGYGRISGGDESESGTRPMLGGGFAIVSRRSGLGVHFGFNKTFIEDGETTFGLGLSLGGKPTP